MRVPDSIERNGLDVQMADLERNIGAAVAIEAETGEPVAQRLGEAVGSVRRGIRAAEAEGERAAVRSGDPNSGGGCGRYRRRSGRCERSQLRSRHPGEGWRQGRGCRYHHHVALTKQGRANSRGQTQFTIDGRSMKAMIAMQLGECANAGVQKAATKAIQTSVSEAHVLGRTTSGRARY
jgi:hypothetical protein